MTQAQDASVKGGLLWVAGPVVGVSAVAFASWYGLSFASWPAVLCTSVFVLGGILWAGWPTPRRLWDRLVGAVVCLFLATLAFWLVPATTGQNLWSARWESIRHLESLHRLAPEGVQGFTRDREARLSLATHFPLYAPDLQAAEESWLTRAVGRAKEKARAMEDPGKALEYLGELGRQLGSTVREGGQVDFSEACTEVIRYHLQGARQRTGTLLLEDRYEELDRLGATFAALPEKQEASWLSPSLNTELEQFGLACRLVAEIGHRGTASARK